ncbi:histidine phosphatase family protein [Psychromarinibacter sp. S121]|uniref:histidine phosphatase family protein n=1 Tax=Psychromarinibacter sp. S121 TaxID=3415127 RepID=UPI003C7ED60A
MADRGYVAFLRHGDYRQRAGAPSARQPYPLTEKGLRQAADGADALAAMVAAHGLTLAPVIYSSRQLRAWQTADAVADRLRSLGHRVDGIEQTSALAERGLGSAANLTVDEIESVLRDDPRYGAPPVGWKSDSDYRLLLEGAESLMDAGQRVARHIEATTQPGLVTIHVGHGASFRHACCCLGILEKAQIAALSMFHAQPSLICHEPDGSWQHLDGAWKIREPEDEPKD